MPIEISVGPPVLTINQGSTFMVTDPNGEIRAESEQGVFADDTRFVSYYAIFANGESWVRLTSSATAYFAGSIHLTNPVIATEDGAIPAGTLALTIGRSVGEGIHEDLDVTNHGLAAVRFNLEIALRSDFADLFEVKAHNFVRRGRIETEWDGAGGEARTTYTNRDFRRRFIYRLLNSDSRPHYANGRVTFAVELAPGASWHTCCYYLLATDARLRAPLYDCRHELGGTELDRRQQKWQRCAATLTSANEDIYRLYRQSVEDMGALRLYDHDFAPDVWLPAAGVPWFVTIFGRDSLIVSLQAMLVHPGLALGALKKLAQYQATEMDDWRDAEPGKIPHEIRFGELAHFHKIPHTPYYGTADATVLYLIVLHEAWKWLGDDGLLRAYRDVALRCLEWIDRYGDLDGDGFQEYKTRSSLGYENVGWKDAGDAIVYPDGSQVKQPKALCELQGYVFDAWQRMAEVFDALGEPERAAGLRRKAADLQRRFEAAFWCEESGCYAFGLDPDKQPVKTIASNAGHPLWSGIATPEHAARVVDRLMQPDMSSGWGIRTLSARNPAYNPFSYQRGSVWPHDNGIIALGFRRYGFAAEAARIFRGVSEAASSSSATGCRSGTPASSGGPGPSRCSIWGRTSLRRGRPGAPSTCSRRSSACTRTRRTAGCSLPRSCPAGFPTWCCAASRWARAPWISASGATAAARGGRCWPGRATSRCWSGPGSRGVWRHETSSGEPDVEPAFRAAREAGVRVVALTNGSAATARDLLQRAGLDRFVEQSISIDDVRHWKPRPEVYRHAAQAVGVEPAALALVAAHAWDILGARQAGLVTGWVSRLEREFQPAMGSPDVQGATLVEAVHALLALSER